MPRRLQELHPALVHFPVTLLPVAIGADVIGRIAGSPSGGGLRDNVPELTVHRPAPPAREAAATLPRGVRHTGQHIADGDIAPTLGLDGDAHGEAHSATQQADQPRR